MTALKSAQRTSDRNRQVRHTSANIRRRAERAQKIAQLQSNFRLQRHMEIRQRKFLTRLFDAAIAATDPRQILKGFLPDKPRGRTVIVGAGKGAAQLARAFEQIWDGPLSGAVVTRYGHAVSCKNIQILEAGHPIPDRAGLVASGKLINLVRGLTADDLVVALICGGGSALTPAPPEGLTLTDVQALDRVLLQSGAPINVMNLLRKQVSRIKGGRLAAAAAPARVVSLIVSDVPGDAAAEVASGLTIADGSGPGDALRAADLYQIELPEKIRTYLNNAERSPQHSHSVLRAGDALFVRNEHHIIASARAAIEAAARAAHARGFQTAILSDSIEGEAREIGQMHAAIVREVVERGRPFKAPVVLLSGGETSVTLRGTGKGGRNTEFLLSLALGIEGYPHVAALAADTDGIDGSEDNAGAFADGMTAQRLRRAGLDPRAMLANNDAWSAFSTLDDLFVSGPTGTNVNDFRAILIDGTR